LLIGRLIDVGVAAETFGNRAFSGFRHALSP
jgi:hypothetical protein